MGLHMHAEFILTYMYFYANVHIPTYMYTRLFTFEKTKNYNVHES